MDKEILSLIVIGVLKMYQHLMRMHIQRTFMSSTRGVKPVIMLHNNDEQEAEGAFTISTFVLR